MGLGMRDWGEGGRIHGACLRVWNGNEALRGVGKFDLEQRRPLRREYDALAALILQHPTTCYID